MKLTNPKTNQSLESRFASHAEAAEFLATLITAGEFGTGDRAEFPKDLVEAVKRMGESISAGRAFWLHKLASEGRPKPTVAGSFNLAGLKTLFAKASAKLKRPAIVLATSAGAEVKVSVAGSGSRYPGHIMVASPEFGGAYYGRVSDAGDFFAGRDANEEIKALLNELATDAASCAAKHGHMTGNCCFCRRPLSDAKSTEVGYGPTCASKFGLPWGAKVSALAAR